jgi:hypothetical protein
MNANPRQIALGAALLATLAATAWVASRPEDVAAPVAAVQPARRPAAAASAPEVTLSADARRPWAEPPAAQLVAWQPPPPPPAPAAPPPLAAAPPPLPMAPPLPYQMIGRLVEGEGASAVDVALLTGPSRAFSVRHGDVIDGQWRVEQVTPSGVRLTWLPAKLPQNLVFKAVP